MPSRMIHYLVAERVAKEISICDLNRFKIGSLCPDMSTRQDDSRGALSLDHGWDLVS